MVATSAPLSETQTGVLGPRDMPQALTRFGSVKVATPGWSDTRFSCRNVPAPAAPAGTANAPANAPANASDSAAAMKRRFVTMTRLLDVEGGRRERRPPFCVAGLVYGVTVVVNTSVRLAVLPEFAWTKNGWKTLPATSMPS